MSGLATAGSSGFLTDAQRAALDAALQAKQEAGEAPGDRNEDQPRLMLIRAFAAHDAVICIIPSEFRASAAPRVWRAPAMRPPSARDALCVQEEHAPQRSRDWHAPHPL